MARLKDKVQNALDESRLLILGSQVLLGFHYRSVFEFGFDKLPHHVRYLDLGGLFLLLAVIALLIAPGAYHRLVARGEDTEDMHQFATAVMGTALLPFAGAVGIDLFIAGEKIAGRTAGVITGSLSVFLALVFWYGLEAAHRLKSAAEGRKSVSNGDQSYHTKLRDKIQHVLTEARVVLPGD